MAEDKSLTVQDVADFLNISKQMAYNLVKDGRLQAFKVGTATRILYSDLLTFVREQKKTFSGRQDRLATTPEDGDFSLEELRAVRGSFQLGPVSLTFQRGRVLAVVGPSGSGKTLLLRSIAGLEPSASGVVLNGQRRIDDLPTPDRDLSFVFEDYALFPHLDVRKNVGFPLSIRRWAEVEKRLSTDLRFEELGLERKYSFDTPSSLPEGMKQLVAIARERNHTADTFLMDEPMTRLDADQHRSMRVFMQKVIRDMGKTTIISTHDPQDALALSDYVLVLEEGRSVQFGETWDVYHRPASIRVLELLSVNGINQVEVEVKDGHTRPLGLAVDQPDGAYRLAFRVDEVTVDPKGIPCSVVTNRFYDGKQAMVGLSTSDGTILEAIVPHESSKGDIGITPLRPLLFSA